jgi:hypothetical protein
LLARRPILLFVLGLVLVGLGIVPPALAVIEFFSEGVVVAKEVLCVLWLILGVPALYQAFRRGYVLEVQTPSGLHRLEFKGGVQPQELEEFLDRVEREFGYTVERSGMLEA